MRNLSPGSQRGVLETPHLLTAGRGRLTIKTVPNMMTACRLLGNRVPLFVPLPRLGPVRPTSGALLRMRTSPCVRVRARALPPRCCRFLSVPRSPLVLVSRLWPPAGEDPGAWGLDTVRPGRHPAGVRLCGQGSLRRAETRAGTPGRDPGARGPGPRGRAAEQGRRAPDPARLHRGGLAEAHGTVRPPGGTLSWVSLSRRPRAGSSEQRPWEAERRGPRERSAGGAASILQPREP